MENAGYHRLEVAGASLTSGGISVFVEHRS
jgi:hypothetical protein